MLGGFATLLLIKTHPPGISAPTGLPTLPGVVRAHGSLIEAHGGVIPERPLSPYSCKSVLNRSTSETQGLSASSTNENHANCGQNENAGDRDRQVNGRLPEIDYGKILRYVELLHRLERMTSRFESTSTFSTLSK